MPQVKEIMCSRAFINIKMLLTATLVANFVCDLTSAQNPYGLKRPSYCSTCFTNDKSENYYCCYYFFRCCAESRLGSHNRKVTTPSPEYPDFHTTHAPQTSTSRITTPADDVICKKCIPRIAAGSRKPGAEGVFPVGDDDGNFGAEQQQKAVDVRKTIEVTPQYMDGSELSRGYSYTRRNPDTSYSSAVGGRRYPYNVPRVYPSQQQQRNNEWRAPQNQRSNIRHGENSEDSSRLRIRQNGKPNGQESDDIQWGRMEPVGENDQWT